MGSRPPEFDETGSSWDAYRVRLEAYFEGDDITDSSKRRALLVASLSDSVVRVIQGRYPSTPVNSLTYEEVAKVLEEHYSTQHTGKDCIEDRLQFSGNSAGGRRSRSKCNAELQSSCPSVTRLDARNMGAGSSPNSTPSFNANKTPSGTTGLLKRFRLCSVVDKAALTRIFSLSLVRK
ncbi:hypothetical protein MTO96_011414 [Rhipicephalus appendiculatus]